MNEEWRDIPGFEGLYKVSNKGEVKSLNYRRTNRERILKPGKDRNGYFQLLLYKKGKIKNMQIHRLVAQAFIPNPYNLPQVNHRNECKTDNRVENLEFCTQEYNLKYGSHNDRVVKANINNPKKSKSVICIETGKIYPSTMEAQRQLGFPHQHIVSCCNKKYGHKTVCGFHFEYVE